MEGTKPDARLAAEAGQQGQVKAEIGSSQGLVWALKRLGSKAQTEAMVAATVSTLPPRHHKSSKQVTQRAEQQVTQSYWGEWIRD